MPYSRNRLWLLLALTGIVVAPHLPAQDIAIANTQLLAFGRFVAATGSVTISPFGARSASGGVVLLQTGPGQAAQFIVSGNANATYAVTLPADGTVSIANGGYSMSLNGFTSSPSLAGVLPGSGSQTLSVGARLDVVAGQPPGAYSGSFIVVVEYN